MTTSNNVLTSISSQEFKTLIDSRSTNDVILDIRTPGEYAEGHIKGAQLLDYYKKTFIDELGALSKSTTYYMYCRSGNRSGHTLKIMKKLNFKNVYNLKLGISEWISLEYPVFVNL